MGDSRYETLLPIGTGGMATVFIGRSRGDEGFSRLVALKRAHAHVRSDSALVEGMKREARLASRLHHANVVSVLDVDEDEGDLVLVLDYVEGCTLRTLLHKTNERLGETRPRETLRIILDVAAGLHAAHQTVGDDGRLLGLVHRDVSPSNVLVGVDGVTRISDFGIAKAVFEGATPGAERTEAGILKGKSSYMAPEYVMHQRASAASDLFSLAVMTWEALASTRLFKGTTEIDTLKRVAEAKFRPLGDKHPELAALDVVLSRALSRLPGDRHTSVEHFAIELEAVARSNDLVASHMDVSALVQRVMKQELEDRRRALKKDDETVVAPMGSIGSINIPIPSALMRAAAEANKTGGGGGGASTDDDFVTTAPQSSRGKIEPAAQSAPPSKRSISTASLKAVPAPPSPSSTRASAARMLSAPPSSRRSQQDRIATINEPAIIAQPQQQQQPSTAPHPPAAPAIPAPAPAPAPIPQSAQPTQRTKKHAQQRSRGKEFLALFGAFALLGLALAAMAWRLKTGSGFDVPQPVSPTTLPTPSSALQTSAIDSGDVLDASGIADATDESSAPTSASATPPIPSASAQTSASGKKHPKKPPPPSPSPSR